MNWNNWLEGTGLSLNVTPDIESILIAVIVVVGAYAIGWFAGGSVGPKLAAALYSLMGRKEAPKRENTAGIMRFGTTWLLLLVALRSADYGPFALLLIALALGVAVGLFVNSLLCVFGVGGRWRGALGFGAMIIGVIAALGGFAPVARGLDEVSLKAGSYSFSLLDAVNIIIFGALLIVAVRIAIKILNHTIGRISALDISQQVLAQKIAGTVVIVIAVLFAIDMIGIDLTALAVFSGALGLAVGFGLQKTFGNLLAGVILLMDRSVKPGDVIVVEDTFGEVKKIGVRAVSVVTRDGKEHLIPNEQLMVEPVENWSYSNRNVRIHIPVGVSYEADIGLAQKLMLEAATSASRALKSPAPSIWMTGYGDSSVDHEILVWIRDPEKGVGSVRSEILNTLWVLFKENDIEIPFPQRDLHIRSAPGLAGPPEKDPLPPPETTT